MREEKIIEAIFIIADGMRHVSQGLERLAEELDLDRHQAMQVREDDDPGDPRGD